MTRRFDLLLMLLICVIVGAYLVWVAEGTRKNVPNEYVARSDSMESMRILMPNAIFGDSNVVQHSDGIKFWVEPPKKRYFFVCYLAMDNKGNSTYGNYYRIDSTMPQYDSLEKWAFKQATKTAVSFSKFTITGLYEFKDSVEYANFKK